MKAVVFVLANPDPEWVWNTSAGRPKFGNFIDTVNPLVPDSKHCERLSDTVWLCRIDESFSEISCLVSIAEKQNLAYRVLPLEHTLEWVCFDPNQKMANKNETTHSS